MRAFVRQAAGKNCGKIVERFCAHSFRKYFYNYCTIIPYRPCLSRVRKIFLQFFLNSSLCGIIWCIRIGLEKNCRRNNRRKIVETFGECRPICRHRMRQPEKNCGKIVEELWKNCRKILRILVRTGKNCGNILARALGGEEL